MAFILLSNSLACIQVYAHDTNLNINYDDCIGDKTCDGIEETWYILDTSTSTYHLSHETITIKYYFEEYSKDGLYTWTTDVTNDVANEIKSAYANSMKKWNNVYFYSYDSDGNITKRKIINLVEGTALDHDLSIYPKSGSGSIADTQAVGGLETIETGTITHRHYSQWDMNVYVHHFYVHDSITADQVDLVRERNGAHEFGHVLGLRDVDNLCSAAGSENHHHELLMGYGAPLTAREENITYKDIAGVAITRGFHTDSDHKWLNCGIQSDGTYKLICSICNGVKYVSSLSGYSYNSYNFCGGSHNLSSGNMMAVASYENKDYYKCKYCRYVAPVSNIVIQNYSLVNYSATQHQFVNNVSGLNYSYVENHNWRIYIYYDYISHRRTCACGAFQFEEHYVKRSDIVDDRYAECLGCGYMLDFTDDIASIIQNNNKITLNGSYILSSGIVVLADEDIEAYLNGTLQFYDGNKLPDVG